MAKTHFQYLYAINALAVAFHLLVGEGVRGDVTNRASDEFYNGIEWIKNFVKAITLTNLLSTE